MKSRNKEIDVFRGVLIILVVVGHIGVGMTHDIIFLFHMPLFFMISGAVLDKTHLLKNGYIKDKAKYLMIPYLTYLIVDMIIVQRSCSIGAITHAIWGGRAITGVYWYVTCYLFALCLFKILLQRFSDQIIKRLILVGGGWRLLSRI